MPDTLYGFAFGVARAAAFNDRNNPHHFFRGEIAGQLGKGRQFRSFWTNGLKAPDEKDWLKLFDGGEPILILFDEMPPHFHYPQKVGNGTVADIAMRAFANLLTAAGKKSDVCVVVSDLAATYDNGTRLNRAWRMPGRSWAARSGTLRRWTLPLMRSATFSETASLSRSGTQPKEPILPLTYCRKLEEANKA